MISFNFSKKKDSRKLQDSKLRDESTKDDEEDRDFVTSVQGTEIQGTKKKEEKKELVIPLINKNEWRAGPLSILHQQGSSGQSTPLEEGTSDTTSLSREQKEESTGATGANGSQQNDTDQSLIQQNGTPNLDELAIQELLRESQDSANGFSKEDGRVPLLLQNQIPEGYEEDDNMDVSLRPDQSTMEDYERIPIEEFGMAMLRGMGWNKAEGIGLKNKQHVEMLEPQLRPKGLGLGAERPKTTKDVGPSSTNNKDKDEELKFKIGAAAVINKGANKGMYGRVEGIDEDNNRIIIKLAINKKAAAVSKFHMTLVSDKEFEKKSKVLNNDQYDEFKKKHDEKDRRNRESESRKKEEDYSERKRRKDDSGRNSREYDGPVDKKSRRDNQDEISNRDTSSKKKYGSTEHPSVNNWVRPRLRVRFIDRKYKHGKYYEKKFVVEDVVEMDSFVLRSDSGDTLLEDINTSQVETVIPRDPQTPVCILNGKRRGRVGELVDKNRKTQTAVVRIPDGGVIELSYDNICEFVGDPEDYY